MKQFKTPKTFTAQYVRGFLSNVSEIFQLETRQIPDVEFKTEGTQKIDLLGLVLIYKFFEYTVRKRCFLNPTCYLEGSTYVYQELKKYGFRDIVYAFINQKPVDYKKLKRSILEKRVVISLFFWRKILLLMKLVLIPRNYVLIIKTIGMLYS